MVKILEPLCETEQEKTMLQNNAGKLVRECASQAGKEMSWGQTLQREVDKVKDFVKWVLGRENEVQKIIEKHPDIINSLKVRPETNAGSFVKRENSRERSHGVTSREH